MTLPLLVGFSSLVL